jgi:hypothetical protein
MAKKPKKLKNNEVFKNLLNLLKDNPDIVREIVLDAVNLKRVLAQAGVRDPTDFLGYVASERDGYNVVQFLHNSAYLGMCGKGTFLLSCLRGTSPPKV